MASTNITDEHKRVFEALKSGEYRNFALVSCFVDGEPAAAIATVLPTSPETPDSEPDYFVQPTDRAGHLARAPYECMCPHTLRRLGVDDQGNIGWARAHVSCDIYQIDMIWYFVACPPCHAAGIPCHTKRTRRARVGRANRGSR